MPYKLRNMNWYLGTLRLQNFKNTSNDPNVRIHAINSSNQQTINDPILAAKTWTPYLKS